MGSFRQGFVFRVEGVNEFVALDEYEAARELISQSSRCSS
jgi:hypothetical protein